MSVTYFSFNSPYSSFVGYLATDCQIAACLVQPILPWDSCHVILLSHEPYEPLLDDAVTSYTSGTQTFYSHTPRYNFSSTLYPQSCLSTIQVIQVYNLHLK
jgi:hypothetical protein